MTIQLTCPYCRFSKEVPESTIPSTAKRAVCPQCGQQFLFSRPGSEEAPGGSSSPPTPEPSPVETVFETEATLESAAPWEQKNGPGFWATFFQTISAVLFSSKSFFSPDLHPAGRGLRDPLAFGLLSGVLGSMAAFFWQALLALAGFTSFGGLFVGQLTYGLIFVILVLIIPVVVFLGLFVYAGVLHLLMRTTGAGKRRFEGTFRVVAYSQAVQLLAFVPFIGGWIAWIWQLVVQIIGLRAIHETSYGRVILGFLIPVILCLVVGTVTVLLIPLVFLRLS